MVNCIVIDDSQDILDVFSELLDIIKVKVLATGNNGQDAVMLYEKHLPDIVFTDLQMPEYDGIYAVENIKDLKIDAKIIVVTGDLDTANSIVLNSLNVPVIQKPFDIHMLKQAITDILLVESTAPAPFEIKYKFKDDINYYSCTIGYEQYRNLKKLPIIEECTIVNCSKNNDKSSHQKMQKALDLACENNTEYIRKLSEVVG
ncbi:MAG: response regulator [Nitrosopumilus sp.]|nr:response regulator [Nitrosopumilus sp.]